MPSGNQTGERRRPLIHQLSDRANLYSEWVLFAMMLLMVLVIVAQVIFRFLFDALTWSEELSCFLLVFASLLGSAIAFKRGSHIAVTMLRDNLPAGARKVLATVIYALGLGFFSIVAYYGAVMMKEEGGQLTPALQISMRWIYLMYPVVGGITALHLLDGIVTTWEGGK
ncbi:MAG: TRAP transporter small permease [Spirochaetales bacterium]|nr:TRAP transporter small permease [Spirochaetales bacterium]